MGKLDPVIGRDDEIRRAIQVLQRQEQPGIVDQQASVGKKLSCGRLGAAHCCRGARSLKNKRVLSPEHGLALSRIVSR
jgi:ATP-dependent Clp protease ATP-binding subunit ClpB